MRGGSGGLGTYVKEQQKKGNGSTVASAMTVDLTDGIIYPPVVFLLIITNHVQKTRMM